MDTIKLADGLELPTLQAAAQRYSLFGKPGSGKSNAVGLLIEGLLTAGEQVIIFDPASIHWSYRVGHDGKTPAFKIAIFGGEHGDVPLTPSSGALLATTLANSSDSAVIDVSDLTLTEQRHLVTDFFEQFFQAKKRHRSPVLVVLEEAHEFIPQNTQPGQDRMFGAIKRFAKIGRNYGCGLAIIDHRPQEISKAIVNLSEFMGLFQMVGAHERKAVKEWITNNDPERAGLENELPTLPRGTAQVYSPTWLQVYGKFSFPLKATFDAGKTPERGAVPVKLKPIDLDKLRAAMESVEKEAAANNPKILQKRIAELEKQLVTKPTTVAEVKTVIKEVHVIPPDVKANIQAVQRNLAQVAHSIENAMTAIHESVGRLEKIGTGIAAVMPQKSAIRAHSSHRAPFSRRPATTLANSDAPLKAGCLKMINAIASSPTGRRSPQQIATLTGIKVQGSTFATYKSLLVTGGYIVAGDEWELTPAGETLADPNNSIPEDNDALLSFWRTKLKAGAYQLLQHIIENVGPKNSIEKEEWANVVGIDPDGSTLSTYISILVTNGLVKKVGQGEYTPGECWS